MSIYENDVKDLQLWPDTSFTGVIIQLLKHSLKVGNIAEFLDALGVSLEGFGCDCCSFVDISLEIWREERCLV
jgi:hypothetical protein